MHPCPRVQHPSTVSLRLKFQVVESILYPLFLCYFDQYKHRRVETHTHCIVVIAH